MPPTRDRLNRTATPPATPVVPPELAASFPVLLEGRFLWMRDLAVIEGVKPESLEKRLMRNPATMPRVTRIAGRPRFAPMDVVEYLLAARGGA